MLTNRSSVLGRSVAVAAIVGCLAFGSPAYTQQITGVGDTTSTPVAGVPHNYITGVSEIVNPANGALSIRIQAPTPHERGANWPIYPFTYDSNELYTLVPTWVTNGNVNSLFTSLTSLALQDAEGSSVAGQTVTLSFTLPGPPYTLFECEITSGYLYTDPDGGKHGLGLEVTTPVQGGPTACSEGPIAEYQNHYVGGDEQYKAYLNPSTRVATVIDLHGNAVAPASTGLSTEDVNGNEQTVSYNGGTFQATTTTGRNITTTPTSTGYNLSVPGVAPVSGQAAAYITTDETVGAPLIRLNYSIVNGGSACQLTSISNATYSTKQPASVKLPNGETYQFQYDAASGLIDKITYPTGAWVEYTWSVIPNSEGVQYRTMAPNGQGGLCAITHDWFAITKRVVSDDGTNADEEQDFSYSTVWPASGNPNSYEWTSKKTTVTTKDLLHSTQFNTVYSYSPMGSPPEADTAWEDLGDVPQENTIQYFDTNGSLLKTVTKTWQTMSLLSGECETIPNVGTSGKFYTYETYSFGNTGMVILNQGALLTTLPVDVQEYGSGVPTNCTNPGGTPLRETKTTYASFASTPLFSTYSAILDRPSTVQVYGNGALLSETDYNYDQVAPTVVSSVINHDDTNYGPSSTAPRGNPTTVTKKCFVGSAGCTNSVTTYAYDNDGNVLSATDACGNTTCSDMPGSNHTTTYNYADNYTDGTPPGKTNAYVTTITEPSPNGPAMTTKFQWGYNDGKMWSETDANNQTTTFCYRSISLTSTTCPSTSAFDPYFRLTGAGYPDGGSHAIAYNDAGPEPIVTSNVLQKSGTWMTTTTTYNAMGDTIEVQAPTTADVVTTYDGLARAVTVTNPYFTTSDPTYGTTTYTYDALNRKAVQTQPDGSKLYWCYDDIASQGQANCTTHLGSVTTGEWVDYTDEAGNQWQRTNDSLGRLTEVIEEAGTSKLETDYTYDALDNLLRVDQWGGAHGSTGDRVRTFTYDSLSRLLCASNPENSTAACPAGTTSYTAGTVGYTYDANGNVSTKISLLPNQTGTATLTTTNTYDELNRITNVSYSDGITPALAYSYDNPPPWMLTNQNVIGRLANSANAYGGGPSGTATAYSYDSMGRAIRTWEQTPSTSPNGYFVYSGFDLAGDLTSTTTAAGTVISYKYDSAGRLSIVTSSLNDAQHPQTLYSVGTTVGYYPNDAIRKAVLGNGLTESQALNDRLQPCRMSLTSTLFYYTRCSNTAPSGSTIFEFTLGYNAGSTDNGNVVSWSATGQQVFSRAYTYDSGNRISTMTDTASGQACKGLSWSIDQWGNNKAQTQTAGSCFNFSSGVGTNNQLSMFTYDAAGNVTYDGNHNYTYDAEGHVLLVDGGNTASYVYNENGERVRKNAGGGWTEYFYGPNGAVQSELSGTTWPNQYVYAGSRLLAIYTNGTTEFVNPDHLGSTRIVTGVSENIIDNMDYYPFGQQSAGDTATTHKFTGKELDTESGLDYFGARYYTSNMGRFMTADWAAKPEDVPYASLGDPQSLNLYSYVRNNPLSLVDADGHNYCDSCDWLKGDETAQQAVDAATSEMTGAYNSDQYNGGGGQQQPQKLSPTDKVALKAEKAALGPTRESVAEKNSHEYGGLIVRNNKSKKISATDPVRGEGITIDLDSIPVPAGTTVIATYHSHAHSSALEDGGASQGDVDNSRAHHNRPGYVLDSFGGRVYRYDGHTDARPFPAGTYIGTVQ